MSPSQVAEERRVRLLELIRHQGFASLPSLAGELEVSESTIRRDLDQLEELGAAKRTHGGVFYTGPQPKLPHFDLRQPAQWDKKRQIALAASQLIEDGDTILLDGGSTTYELARLLVGRPLQVVTNSLPVANLFMSSKADLVIVGGMGSRFLRPADLISPAGTSGKPFFSSESRILPCWNGCKHRSFIGRGSE